ncbi:MAG TPA: YfhO family protein [Bacteroidota bacterium]|nr:YfhO family protein [Bacteroidota bacterium]
MSKSDKGRPASQGSGPSRKDETLIPEKYQHAVVLIVLFLTLVVFFNQIIFGGKTYLGSDTIASHSWDTVLKEAQAAGTFPLWNPYIFCGMPGYGSLTFGGPRTFDLCWSALSYAHTFVSYLFLAPPEGWIFAYYLFFAAGMYFFIYGKVGQKLAALVGALGATYSMYIIIWVMVGHNTKVATVAMLPYIFLVVERLRVKFDWRLAVVLVLLLHCTFIPGHVQMIFYIYLALGIYFLYFLIRTLVTKGDWKAIVRTGVVFALATGLALTMDADKYLSVWEYNPYSMRGSNPAVQAPGGEKTIEGGLAYDYATEWSFGVGEVATFFVPSWYGFGNTTYRGPLTNDQPQQLPLYFGPQRWTDAPQYMGIVILVLAIFGFIRMRKEPFVQYLGIVVLFSLLVSFGREFPVVYDLMFRYFPTFNKFRIPSMILVLVQVFVPVLAAYGIASYVNARQRTLAPAQEKRWKYVLGGLGVLFVLSLLAPGIFKSIYSSFVPSQESVPKYSSVFGNNQRALAMLYDFVADKVATDILFGLGFLLLVFGAVYRYLHQHLSLTLLGAILIVAVVADLWRIDFQPDNPSERTEMKAVFTAPDYVRYLQQDTTLYRTLLFENGHPPYDNKLAYWKIQSAYGYQGAKMRWFQDIDDVAGMGNPLVWQLMNVKYIISNTPDSSEVLGLVYNGPQYKVYANRAYVPRAFFVNRYEVANGVDILRKMQSMAFAVRDVAYFTEDPKLSIDPPGAAATAEYTHFELQSLGLNVTATGNNLLFLSEAYYPNGWNAYLDGTKIPIYRMDYLFRGVVIPPGSHKLEMKFEPKSFSVGKSASLGMNILLIGGLLFAGYDYWKKRKAAPVETMSPGERKPTAPQPPTGESRA